jgi:hypothetical protein
LDVVVVVVVAVAAVMVGSAAGPATIGGGRGRLGGLWNKVDEREGRAG